MYPESAAFAFPESISAAFDATAMSWLTAEPGFAGPPAKKFLPPLTADWTVASGKPPAAPYSTRVNCPFRVQPGMSADEALASSTP